MLTITHAATLAAYNAATNQAAQIAALLAPWSDGADDVIVRIYDGATLRDTITVGPWTEQASPLPRRIVCGTRLARTNSSTGSYTRMVFATATDEIMELTAGVGTGDVQGYGPITAGSAPNVEGVYVTADDTLPPVAPLAATQVVSDLMYTDGSDRRIIFLPAVREYWIATIKSNSRPAVVAYSPNAGSGTEFELVAGTFQANDHNQASLIQLADGKVRARFQKHNEDTFAYERITSAANAVGAWDAATNPSSSGLVAYAHTHYLSENAKHYAHYRVGIQSQYANSSSDLSTWDTEREWIVNGSQRPYVKSCTNGVDRIDLLFIEGIPTTVTTSLYHCYMELDAGVEKFYKSDGTYISTGIVTPAQATQVYDGTGSDGRCWLHAIKYGSDGHPRVLFTRFASETDHRVMFARWTGSAWVTAELCQSATIHDVTNYAPAGACFDGNTVDRVFACYGTAKPLALGEYRTSDNGANWSLYRTVRAAPTSPATVARPVSAEGHDGTIAVVWIEGEIVDFTDWTAVGMAAGEA